MKKHRILALVCVAFSLAVSACNEIAEVPLVSLDSHGNSTLVKVPEKEYSTQLQVLVSSVHDSALPVLNSRVKKNGWQIRTVAIGIGVNGEAGIGPILKVSALPRTRLIFSNSTNPVLP